MKPQTEYRLEWDTMPVQTTAGEIIATQTIRVSIFDNDNLIADDQITEVIPLTVKGDDPLIISIINNDEDKYTPIRGKQATIKFLSDSSLFQEMATFSDSSDNRWYVEIKDITNTLTIFVGFLMLSDMQQLFQPDPVVVELTASDHLGILKDIPLTDFNEDVPMGKYSMAALLSYALRKTGLSLYWTAINNLRHGGGATIATNVDFNATGNVITVDFFIGFFYVGMPLQIDSASNDMTTTVTEIISSTQIRVADTLVNETATIYNVTFTDLSSADHFYELFNDTKTYEDQIGTLKNCYDVLLAILGEDCFITQHLGKWWIVRIDEYDSGLMYPAEFDPDGTFIEFGAAIDLSKNIGDADLIRFCNADQLLRSGRPHKSVKETFKYEYPLEIVCNLDFSRGDFVESLANEVIESKLYTVKKYELDCWDYGIHKSNGNASTAADGEAYIKKLFYNDYEHSRSVKIEQGTTVEDSIRSTPIYVNKDDKITVGVSTRYNADTNDVTRNIGLELRGNDGSYWYAGRYADSSVGWDTYPVGSGPILFISNPDVDSTDYSQWQTIDYTSTPMPVSGELYVYLYLDIVSGGFDYIEYANLSVQISQFIGGSYRQFNGQYNKVSRSNLDYSANRENEVKISDSPHPTLKGSMFILVDGVYKLTTQFYIAIPGDSRAPNRYGYHQAFSVWNQYRTAFRIISGSVLGLGIDPPDIIHKYILTDSNLNTTGKFFILISYDQNWKTGIWTGVFLEVFDSNVGKNYGDSHEFKYITE